MSERFTCNMENAKFIDKGDDILIEITFMEDRNISVTAKGLYCTFATFQSIRPSGVTINEVLKTCKNTKCEIDNAINELLLLGFLKVVI